MCLSGVLDILAKLLGEGQANCDRHVEEKRRCGNLGLGVVVQHGSDFSCLVDVVLSEKGIVTLEAGDARPDEANWALISDQSVRFFKIWVLAALILANIFDIVKFVLEAEMESVVLEVLGPDGFKALRTSGLVPSTDEIQRGVRVDTGDVIAASPNCSGEFDTFLIFLGDVLKSELEVSLAVAIEQLLRGERALDLLILCVGLHLNLVSFLLAWELELATVCELQVRFDICRNFQLLHHVKNNLTYGFAFLGLDLSREKLDFGLVASIVRATLVGQVEKFYIVSI